MTKRFCLIAALVVINGAAAVSAQEPDLFSRWHTEDRWFVGIYAGYAHNTLFMGGAENIMYFTANEPGHGWTIGIPVRFQIFTWLAFQAEATFITKNYTIRQTSAIGRDLNLHDQHTNSFINIPFMLHFNMQILESPLSFFINGGGYMGVWVASHRQGRALTLNDTVHVYDEYHTFNNRFDNRFDAGLLVGLGLQYRLNFLNIFVEWRYNYGRTDLRKSVQRNQVPNINDTWTIHAGVLLNTQALNAFRRQR